MNTGKGKSQLHRRLQKQRRQDVGTNENEHHHHRLSQNSQNDGSSSKPFRHHSNHSGGGGTSRTKSNTSADSQSTETSSSPSSSSSSNVQQNDQNQQIGSTGSLNDNGGGHRHSNHSNHTDGFHKPLPGGVFGSNVTSQSAHSSNHSKSGTVVGAVVGAVVGGLFLIIFAVIAYMFIRRKRESAERQRQLDASIAAGGFRSSVSSSEEMIPVKLNSAGQSRSDLMKKIDRQTQWIYGPEGTPQASAEVGRQGDAGWSYAKYLGGGSLASGSDEAHVNLNNGVQNQNHIQHQNQQYTSQERLVHEPESNLSYLQDDGSDEDNHYYQLQRQQQHAPPPQYR